MRRKALDIVFIGLALVVAFVLYLVTNIIVGFVFILTIVLLWFINWILKKQLSQVNQRPIRKERNFDALVIGLPINKELERKIQGQRILSFTHQHRSLFASYLYLIHQYSYLKESGNGKIYIVCSNSEKSQNDASLCDVYNLHPVIIKRLNANFVKQFPILYLLRKFHSNDYFIDGSKIPIKERIISFCMERKINLEFVYQ